MVQSLNYSYNAPTLVPVPLDDGTVFEFDWETLRDSFDQLSRAMYVPAFRNALPFAGGTYYDLEVGAALIARFKDLKNGADPEAGDRIVRMTDGLRDVFGFDSLEINVAATDDRFIFIIDGVQRRQTELGAGLSQFVILAVNVLLGQPRLLLLDEPELNLHAKLQLTLLTFMSSLTRGGVVFATHSLGLARAGADVLLLATREAKGDCTLEDFHAATTPAATLGAIGYGGLNDSNYSGVLLVEGASDVRMFQELLGQYGARGAYVVVPLGGGDLAAGGHDQELSELMRLSDNVFAIVDSERTASSLAPIPARQAFADACAKVGINCLVLARRSAENYLDQSVARSVFNAPRNPAFGHFERPKDVGATWNKRENWRIARQMEISKINRTDLAAFLRQMAKAAKS